MPLHDDPEVNKVADQLVDVIRRGYGDVSTKLRPVHARGQLTKGTFVPSPGARYVSKAPIFKTASTPLLARFSCDTGYSEIADTHIDSNPRGLAIRFLLSEDGHTHFDMITNTALGFAVNRGEGFRDMFRFKLGEITEEQLHKDWPHPCRARLEAIARQKKNTEVPEELFTVLQEMQKNLIQFRGKKQKSEALQLVDLEKVHSLSDDLIQRASKCLPSSLASKSRQTSHPVVSTSSSGLYHDIKVPVKPPELFTRDDSYVKEAKPTFYAERIGSGLRSTDVSTSEISDLSLKFPTISGQDGEKLSLIKLAGLIEVHKKKGDPDLNLRSKLMEEVEWLPDSIGKLSSLITLDLSENRILALPATIKGLVSLIKLDLHSNKIVELPDSIGDLLSLVYLDLSMNRIAYLPPTFGRLVRLEELNLSSNRLPVLPESIGSLVNLKKLYVESNNLEEIPFSTTIGRCSSLKELRADCNKLKALPEAIGLIASLEVLSLRYNNIKQLPISVMNLKNLKEIDLSFNELESVPENLCFARTLVKVNLSNNFADLRALPSSIGQLEMLEELDISNNQIRVLPGSFGYLAQLRVLNLEGNPLEEPPRNVAEMGAQAVVEYMSELAAREYALLAVRRRRRNWSPMCCFSKSN